MASLEIQRGRLQSLFQYMPEQTYNWPKGEGSFKGSPRVDARPLDIPLSWMKRHLRRLLYGFVLSQRAVGKEWPGIKIIEDEDFVLLEPRTLRGQYFPRTFICPRCGCLVKSRESPGNIKCQRCPESKMMQHAFVEYHHCGYMGELFPPTCTKKCGKPMALVNSTGAPISSDDRTFKEWRWKCTKCGTASRGIYHFCPECKKSQIRVLAADANQVYYPQTITVINPPTNSDNALLDAPSFGKAAIAQALDALKPGLDSLRQAINDTNTAHGEKTLRHQLQTEYGLDENNPGDWELINQLLVKRSAKHTSENGSWETSVDRLNLDEDLLGELGEECVSLALARTASPLAAQDLTGENDQSPLEEMYKTSYPHALRRYGLTEVMLLQEFPIARIVAGYTREESDPNKLEGLQFVFFPSEGGKKPMYGQRTTTEALLFHLDPVRVLEWLQNCGIMHGIEANDPRSWLFSHLKPVQSIFEPPQDLLTKTVLGLIHSFSHRMIRALAGRSGLRAESLSEYLLPYNTAFLIYPGARSEFVLGGLEHIFRTCLDETLHSMIEDPRCTFDPPCRDRNGACAVCMFVSETTCERFNTSLSRHYLFGGINSDGTKYTGYWTFDRESGKRNIRFPGISSPSRDINQVHGMASRMEERQDGHINRMRIPENR